MSQRRSDTLARLQLAVADARRARPSVLFLRGGIGIGKSWLLDRLESGLDDVRVLRATGHPSESDLPFAGLYSLVAPILHRLPELPPSRADALAAALSLNTAQPGDRLAASAGLLSLLTLEAETSPVVVIVDDYQWIDASTRNALTFVSRRLDADAIVVIFAERPGPRSETSRGGVQIIELELLDDVESRDVLADRFPELNPATTRRVLAQAGGLPLALTQIPADLSLEQRVGRSPLPTPLPLGTDLDRFYTARIAELGSDGRLALALASLEDLDLSRLERALGLLGLTLSPLGAAERAGLVAITQHGCRFAHSTVRSAAQRAFSFDELRRARRAVVDVLPEGSPRAAAHLDALADGVDARAADALDAAAHDAWNRSAYEEAGHSWVAAAHRSPERSNVSARQSRAVAAFVRSGAWASVAPLLDDLIADAPDAQSEASWRSMRLLVQLYSDETPGSGEHVGALARSLSRSAPHVCARLLTTWAFVSLLSGEFRAARSAVDELRALLPGFEFALPDALVHDDVDVVTGRPGAGALLGSDWADGLSDAELCDPSFPVGPVVAHMIWIGHVERARGIVDRQHEALLARGGVSLLDLNLGQRACLMSALGHWDEAHAMFSSASELARAIDFAAPLPHIALRHAYLLAARGDEPGTRAILESVGMLPAATRPIHRHLMLCVEGLLELGLGRAELAASLLAEAAEIERDAGMGEPAFFSRGGDLFDALWRLRREQDALAELGRFEQQAVATARPKTLAVVARCRAISGPSADVDAAFQRAALLHARSDDPFESARTQLAWGQRLRRDRRKADARVPLHHALLAFDALGAQPWASAAMSELLACGERRAVLDSGGPARVLTPREFEVAREVAHGSSNGETAARLFVSKRTVEFHLASVFRKLGVTSRDQLADALDL